MQNRAARLITNNFDFNTRGIDIVRDLGWLNITQRRDYFTALLVFKSLSGNLPDHILDNFTFKRDIPIRKLDRAILMFYMCLKSTDLHLRVHYKLMGL